jgi:uroporphyrinogen III methyltransferase/synthase
MAAMSGANDLAEGTPWIRGGVVYFVGTGPGTRDYLTVRALEVLRAAQLVVWEASVRDEIRSLASPRSAIDVARRADLEKNVQNAILESARRGDVTVVAAEGDALLFDHFSRWVEHVAGAGVPVEVVPAAGMASTLGACTGLRTVRHGDASPGLGILRVDLAFVGLFPWDKLATGLDVLLLDAERSAVSEIAAALIGEGLSPSTPAALIVDMGSPSQRCIIESLATVATRARSLPPSTLRVLLAAGEGIVGTSASRWFERRPLFGKKVVVLRAAHQAEPTVRALRSRGAVPIALPLLRMVPPDDGRPMGEALGALAAGERDGWVIFTSPNGVAFTFAALAEAGRDGRVFGRVRIACIGPGTAAALAAQGIRADLQPEEFRGEALAAAMVASGVSGAAGAHYPKRALLLRAQEARDVLPETLRGAGWGVDVVPVYRTLGVSESERGPLAEAVRVADAVLFTSASTVAQYADALGDEAFASKRVCYASIGPITSDALRARGGEATVTAATYTLPGLLDALEEHFSRR